MEPLVGNDGIEPPPLGKTPANYHYPNSQSCALLRNYPTTFMKPSQSH
jgi:hypothetical protein